MIALSRRAISFIAAAAILFCGCSSKSRPTAWSNATGAEQFERLWWSEVKAKHWNEVEYRMAASYVSVTPEGVRDREQTLARLKQLEIEDYALGDVDIRPNGSDLVITYTLTLKGTLAGTPLSLARANMMTVWQQQKSGWVAIAHSTVAENL